MRSGFLISMIIVLLHPAGAVHAQVARPDSVSIEFVELLALMPMLGGQQEVAVGRLPEQLADVLRPGPEVRVVGSLIGPQFSVSAAIAAGQPAEVRSRWVGQFLDAGWANRPEPGRVSGGFEATDSDTGSPAGLCSVDDRSVSVATRSHRGDSTVVLLYVTKSGLDSSCLAPQMMGRAAFEISLPIPTLRAPPGAQHRGGGSGGGGDEGHASVRLRTELSPGALIAHYAEQMIEQGWQPVTQATSEDAGVHVFRKTDPDDEPWHGVLSVTLLPTGTRDLYLRITRARQ